MSAEAASIADRDPAGMLNRQVQVLATPAKPAPRQFGDDKVAVSELDGDVITDVLVIGLVMGRVARSASPDLDGDSVGRRGGHVDGARCQADVGVDGF